MVNRMITIWPNKLKPQIFISSFVFDCSSEFRKSRVRLKTSQTTVSTTSCKILTYCTKRWELKKSSLFPRKQSVLKKSWFCYKMSLFNNETVGSGSWIEVVVNSVNLKESASNHSWICAMLCSALVGLSGLFPIFLLSHRDLNGNNTETEKSKKKSSEPSNLRFLFKYYSQICKKLQKY